LAASAVLAVGAVAWICRALFAASVAVFAVVLEVDLAAVFALVVAVGKAIIAGDSTHAGDAAGVTVQVGANGVASAAVELVSLQIDFTAVGRITITVLKTRLTTVGLDATFAGAALGGSVRQFADVAAEATIFGVRARVHLARVGVLLVAIRETVGALGAAHVAVAFPADAVLAQQARLVLGAGRAVPTAIQGGFFAVFYLVIAGSGQALGVFAHARFAIRAGVTALTHDAWLAAGASTVFVRLFAVLRPVHTTRLETRTLVAQQVRLAIRYVRTTLAGTAGQAATTAIKVGLARLAI